MVKPICVIHHIHYKDTKDIEFVTYRVEREGENGEEWHNVNVNNKVTKETG